MHYYAVAVSGTPLPSLTYCSEQQLVAGARVLVPLGSRELVGIVLSETEQPEANFAIKSIIACLDAQPLWSSAEWALLNWCHRYYHADWGRLFETALPTQFRKHQERKRASKPLTAPTIGTAQLVELNEEQHLAVTQVQQYLNAFRAWLLMGVTGSGKTEVYAHLIHQQLQQGKQVLLLVPEIGLTTPMVQRLAKSLATEPLQLHSERTDVQRAKIWQLTRSGAPLLLIGTRSAIFVPLPNLGLILVDEEHDAAYKQQDSIRYHARDVALMRAKLQQVPILLGSATPSLESLANVERQRMHLLTLTQRANQHQLPSIHSIDMRQQPLDSALSPQLIQAMQQTLEAGQQVLLFLNRRGYAPVLMCHDCGHTMDCPACDIPYTFHRSQPNLRCHHCGKVDYHHQSCPNCAATAWHLVGQGTQKLEETLQLQFAGMPIMRIDRDSTQGKDTLTNLLDRIAQNEPCIILGTQMLAKGHDFSHIALVGIIDVDSALFARDFRSLERLAQMVTQVAGRAGRANIHGKVLLQTHQPHHPFVGMLLTQPYADIARYLLSERQEAELPPYAHSAWLLVEGKQLDRVQQQLNHLIAYANCPAVEIAGPMPALMHKRQHYFRELLWLQSTQRAALHGCITQLLDYLQQPKAQLSGVRVFLDVDPQDMP